MEQGQPEEVKVSMEAKKLLVEGNERFVSGETAEKDIGPGRRKELLGRQKPFTVIVCCSDSRVPPEIIFDQGLGDMFVVRVAGNVVDPVAMGSVEFAVDSLRVPLVVIMGHEDCGAVRATCEGGAVPGSIGSIVEKIRPAVEEARSDGAEANLVRRAVECNVNNVVKQLRQSPVIAEKRGEEEVSVLGAVYELGSGKVKWL